MRRERRGFPALAVLVAAHVGGAALLAACGGSDSNVATQQRKRSPRTSTTTTLPKPTVQVAETALGSILVDENGLTLYQLDTDTATALTCDAACAATWPPLLVKGAPTSSLRMDRARLAQAAPVAGPGVDPALLGTIDGPLGQQVTYAGHPLYRFSGDLAAGETNGFGVGGIWWVLAPDGTRIAPPPPPSTQPRSVPAPTAPTAPPETAAEPPPPPPEPPPSYSPPPYDY